MADRINYNGSDRWKIKATELLNEGGGGGGSSTIINPFSLKDRVFIFIGDSYQEGWTSGGTITSWLDYMISWYGSEWNGYYRNERGGWGFAKTDCQFITLLQNLSGSITDRSIITDIVVEGGYNDHGYLDELDSAIQQFKNYCSIYYQNATCWIAPISWGINQYSADASAAHQIYINSGMRYGYNICGEITRVMRDTSLISEDKVHPNEAGYKRIARLMHQCLTTGSCDIPNVTDSEKASWNNKVTAYISQVDGKRLILSKE